MKPFLKWAGNKYALIERIRPLLPAGKRLIEPFAGASAVFLNTDYPRYLLADNNADLIRLYHFIQQENERFITYCKDFFQPKNNTKQAFHEWRGVFNTTDDLRLKAALFVYLNKHAFNGLCRYNSSGEFNVSFGRYEQPYFPEKEMHSFALKAKKARFIQADFTKTLAQARLGDVVYCDPPYVPLSDTANFTKYSASNFDNAQQLLLAAWAEKLASRGIPVVISNHATEFVYEAYRKAKLIEFPVQRYISCQGDNRGKVAEVLAVFS